MLFKTEEERKRNQAKKEINIRLVNSRITREIKTLFEPENDDDYFTPEKECIFSNNDYIEYESKSDRNRNLVSEESVNKIKPYLRDIIVDLEKSNTQKILSTVDIIKFYVKL